MWAQRTAYEFVAYFDEQRFGEPLGEAVRNALFAADVFVAEVGSRRPNVFYELGLAEASGKRIVLFQSNDVDAPTPSDVLDKVLGKYENKADLEAKLANRLVDFANAQLFETRTGHSSISPNCFWFPREVQSIHIICSPEPKETMYEGDPRTDFSGIDRLEDRDALLTMHGYLCRSFPGAQVFVESSENVSDSLISQNLVVLGGPSKNALNRSMSSAVRSSVAYSVDKTAMNFTDGSTLSSGIENGSEPFDCGFFGLYVNPFGNGTRVAMCHGTYTFGTLGAVRLLSDRVAGSTNLMYLEDAGAKNLSNLTELEIGFRVPVFDRSRIRCPNLFDDRIFLRMR